MKALKLFFVAALLLPLLSGCKEDEPLSTDMLVGNWYCHKSEKVELYSFKSYGTYVGYEVVDLIKGTYGAKWVGSSWRFDPVQNMLFLDENDRYPTIFKVVHASENELVLSEYDGGDGDDDDWDSPEVFRRISDSEMPIRESY